MKEARLLKILVEEKGLVRLLKTLGTGRGYATRELLTKLGAYGYGHKQLLKAQKRGLVARKSVKNKVFNNLTEDGKKTCETSKRDRSIKTPPKFISSSYPLKLLKIELGHVNSCYQIKSRVFSS